MPAVANSPALAYERIVDIVEQIRNRCTRMSADLGAGSAIQGADVLRLYESLGAYRVKMVAFAATPNLNAYIKALYSDAAADLVADWTALRTQLDTFITLVDANYPKQAGNWILVQTAGGVVTWTLVRDVLTAAQVTGFRNQLNALASAAAAIA